MLLVQEPHFKFHTVRGRIAKKSPAEAGSKIFKHLTQSQSKVNLMRTYF
jgi:hypothetical protein